MIPFALIVGVGLLLSILSPWVVRRGNRSGGSLLALYPAAVFAYTLWLQLWGLEGKALVGSVPWIPSLGISLGIYVDGLSTLFLLVISGIGTFVLLYADPYLGAHRNKGRFYGVVILFMVSMIGLVIAGDLLVVFLFWELTGISSFLLIGFNNEQEASRRAALHALLVTGIGGLALLAGFVLMGAASGDFGIPALLKAEGSLQAHALYLPMLLLILAGVFTKSAQVPFHFWLPSAMEAPTPVSAYLHSATMVKAGVFLLARLSPVLGGTDQWHAIVTTAGAITMLFGALVGYFQRDLKAVLAYTTISALGTLVLLLGLNTSLSAQAAMVFLVVHSLYKGGLFLVTGSIDHETGTRDIEKLGSLRSVMPITGAAAVLAAVSMAGLPPMLGYISKELLYEAKLQAGSLAPLITGAGVFANFMVAATATMIVVRVFFGSVEEPWEHVHEVPFSMWIGPLVLAGAGFAIALFPERFGDVIIEPAVLAIHAEITEPEIPLWQGMSPVFLLSILTIFLGLLLFLGHRPLRAMMRRVAIPLPFRPSDAFESMLSGMKTFANRLTGVLQSGYLRRYVGVVIGTAVVMVGGTLLRFARPIVSSALSGHPSTGDCCGPRDGGRGCGGGPLPFPHGGNSGDGGCGVWNGTAVCILQRAGSGDDPGRGGDTYCCHLRPDCPQTTAVLRLLTAAGAGPGCCDCHYRRWIHVAPHAPDGACADREFDIGVLCREQSTAGQWEKRGERNTR